VADAAPERAMTGSRAGLACTLSALLARAGR
jgi:hypothetical protein